MEDRELLREFTRSRSEEAFAELVARYLGLVYTTGLRVVGEAQMAQDVAQTVFIQLARQGGSVREGSALGGWLYRATCNAAANALRAERRRREREGEAVSGGYMNSESDATWESLAPVLEKAMEQLNSKDQDAIVLRYFEGKSLREVGQGIGTTDDAAQKRVSRALETLRSYFAGKGINTSSSLIASAMVGHAVQTAPAGLAAVVTGASLSAAAAPLNLASILKALFMTKAKTTVVAALVLAAVVTPLIVQHGENVRLRREVFSLRQQNAGVSEGGQRESSMLAQSRVTNAAASLNWSALESPDYRQYVANLRAAGIPEQIIRDIITSDLDRTYGQRIAKLQAPASAKEYWKIGSYKGAIRQSVEVKQIEEQKRAAIHDLLGIDAEEEAQRRTGFSIPYDEGFEFLPAEKRARLREIDREYNAKRLAREGVPLPGPGPNDPLSEPKAAETRDAAVKDLLSPEEFREYEMRFGSHNGFLRTALKAFEPSEQEFRKMFEIETQFLSARSDTPGGDGTVREETPASPFAKWVIPDAANNRQLQDALRQALGDQRYQDYKLTGDTRFVILYDIAQEYNLSKDAARAAYDLDKAAIARAEAIRGDPGLAPEGREAACQQLRTQSEAQIAKLLGDDGLALFRLQLRADLNKIAPETAAEP
jgi:RNA polymerase sigma factor (sigma-70 family)